MSNPAHQLPRLSPIEIDKARARHPDIEYTSNNASGDKDLSMSFLLLIFVQHHDYIHKLHGLQNGMAVSFLILRKICDGGHGRY